MTLEVEKCSLAYKQISNTAEHNCSLLEDYVLGSRLTPAQKTNKHQSKNT